jgi:hypothetical protein
VFAAALFALAFSCAGETVRLPITRDTFVSGAPGEQEGNNGGSARLKCKSYQEFSLVDFDARSLAGRVVLSAALHVHLSTAEVLRRVTVSTVASAWGEGRGRSYEREPGGASFRFAAEPRAWSVDGGDITSVVLGQGSTTWRWADATPPDEQRWQTIAVDPALVGACIAGTSSGLLLFDDVGSEYTRDGEHFEYRLFPNRFFDSRESGAETAPYLEVELGGEDHEAPDAVGEGFSLEGKLARGESEHWFSVPEDHGGAGVVGFEARWFRLDPALQRGPEESDWETATPFPRERNPCIQHNGTVIWTFRKSDFPEADETKTGKLILLLRTLDAAGNASKPRSISASAFAGDGEVERTIDWAREPLATAVATATETAAPRVGGLELGVIDAQDKLDPRRGTLIPRRPLAYRLSNHLWSAADRTIRLAGARNEFVEFQLVLSGRAKDIAVEASFADDEVRTRIARCAPVATRDGFLPDPLVPLEATFSIPDEHRPVEGERHASLKIELLVAHAAKTGVHRGSLRVRVGAQELVLPIELEVWDFALPDQLSFLAEMNAYALPDDDRAWYRLAQEHRTVLNRLGYDWKGRVSRGCGPKWDGERFDWDEYDAHFGPLLDGSAFADLPRGKVPVETFYLPLNENWPVPIEPGFRGGYWADEALDLAYLAAFWRACRSFAVHCDLRGWQETLFELYLNNKVWFKDHEWSRSSAPWVFDEPENTQDFFALRVFGAAFQSAVAGPRGPSKLVFRCDLSRPEWRRELLDGIVDVAVVGSALRTHGDLVRDRARAHGELVQNYATANAIEDPNTMPVAWCLDAWSLGADGVIPWQTIGSASSWQRADPLALLYPGEPVGSASPLPSLRLAAFRRGEQDVEYLTLYLHATGSDRAEVARALRSVLDLEARTARRDANDAGTLAYPGVLPEHLSAWRRRLGRELGQLHPVPVSRALGLLPSSRTSSSTPEIFRARTGPESPR